MITVDRLILTLVKPFAAMLVLPLLGVLAATGCVRRQMTVTSEPAGALVYLNDREVGRTPFTTDFVWYGTYDVVVRKEGYETLNTRTRVVAPWWGWPPIDFLAEIAPWHPTDHRKVNYVLSEAPEITSDALIQRGLELKRQLPATRPAMATR